MTQQPPVWLKDAVKGADALRWIAVAAAAAYGLYLLSRAYGRLDDAAKVITDPLGRLWSDIAAGERVELTALVLEPHYFVTGSYVLTDDAREVLARTYPDEYRRLFGQGGVLKPDFYHLIGKQITAERLGG